MGKRASHFPPQTFSGGRRLGISLHARRHILIALNQGELNFQIWWAIWDEGDRKGVIIPGNLDFI